MKRWRWAPCREFPNDSDWGFGERVGDGIEIDPDDDCGAGNPGAEVSDQYYDFVELGLPESAYLVPAWEEYVLEVRS